MTARRWQLGLAGHPVSHSLSPAIHAAALEHFGVEGSYSLFDVESAALPALLGELAGGELDGLNVTVPHKRTVRSLCDRLAESAREADAVNTLVRAPDGRVIGHNTDVYGLTRALVERWPERAWRDRPVAVVGAGGAARAAVLAAVRTGASEVRVINRTASRAEELVADLGARVKPARLRHTPGHADAFARAALVLHATTMGMATAPHSESWSEVFDAATSQLGGIAKDAVLMDLVYRPLETPWVAAARELGREAEHGLDMLVFQAAQAFEAWTGLRPAPVTTMRAAALAALREQRREGSG